MRKAGGIAGAREEGCQEKNPIDPALQLNASAGVDLYPSDRIRVRLQPDGENLNNVLDVIDFGGLFSGNAIGPPMAGAISMPGRR